MKHKFVKFLGVCAVSLSVAAVGVMCAAAEPGRGSAANGNAGVAAFIGQDANGTSFLANTAQGGQNPAQTAAPTENTASPSLAFGYNNLGISKAEGHLNIRSTPEDGGEILGVLPENAGCEIRGEENGWYAITSGKVEGYVKGEFLRTGQEAIDYAPGVVTTMAVVNTDTLKVREEPSTESDVLTLIAREDALEVLEDQGDWVKVSIDGDVGYVFKEFVTVSNSLKKAMTIDELKYGMGVSDVRVDLVQYALQFVGNPYVWGGTSLTNGADCSGFVLSVYAKYGIYLPHYTGSQAVMGRRISPQEAQPGDLFFYGGGIDHVAIYIGGGQAVHAYSEDVGITVTSAYYRTPVCVVSLL